MTKFKDIRILKGLQISSNTFVNKWLKSIGFDEKSAEYLLSPSIPPHWTTIPGAEYLVSEILSLPQDSHITILGDYDADGITATTILYHALKLAGKKNINFFIPHRIKDGYGISKSVVDKIQQMNDSKTDIIITCDNGVNNLEAVDYARSLGIRIFVTDHHTVDKEKLDAHKEGLTLVHPHYGKAENEPKVSDYRPCVEISGAQIAYEIYQGVLSKSPRAEDESVQEMNRYMLQLASISIVSDVMPIASIQDNAAINFNRYRLKEGLSSLKEEPNWRLKKLLELMDIDEKSIDEMTIAFYIAPVLNAAGRLANAEMAVRVLTSEDQEQVDIGISSLIYLNEERKSLKTIWLEKALKEIRQEDTWNCICLDGIHEGIVGILAGQIADSTGKPTIVLASCIQNGEKAWKGSGRNAGKISMYDWLSFAKAHLYSFGGHEGAVGLTVMDKDLEAMKKALPDIPNLELEKKVLPMREDFIDATAKELKQFKPLGNGLPKPMFRTKFAIQSMDIFFKSGAVKFTTMQGMEFWVYRKSEELSGNTKKWGLHQVKSNLEKRALEMGYQEAYNGRWEKYMPKLGSRFELECIYELDWGYNMMNEEGPLIQLLDIIV